MGFAEIGIQHVSTRAWISTCSTLGIFYTSSYQVIEYHLSEY